MYKEYEYISLWLCLPGKLLKMKEKKLVKKKIFKDILLREKNRYQVFRNYSQILPI